MPSSVTKEFFIEINLVDEPQKYGLSQEEIPIFLEDRTQVETIGINGFNVYSSI